MTLDDAASQRQHASDLADYQSMEDLKGQLGKALTDGKWDRAIDIFGDLTKLAVLAEREACAKINEREHAIHDDGMCDGSCSSLRNAAAIRARP